MADSSNDNDSTADFAHDSFEELERIFDIVAAEPRDRQFEVLERVCPDPKMRQQVRELLAADCQTDLLDHELVPKTAKLAPGELVGPYELLEEVGQGGMGVVYQAQQLEPIRRKVALKVIKPGVDTRQVIARFEAERQALSVMNHPNIAKVLDAGETENGRPYFVMEMVQGEPITEYCYRKQLTTRQRLELFVPVCEAIQHAHQKGIIHRDIKPSNVLVAEYDGRPAAKVIDFGVAKAIDQALSDLTVFTGFGQIVGTFEYMSPEQSQLNRTDIDTRTDIYSLGVLLYELLTGRPPFDKTRLRSVAWDEMLRIIREEDPPKPSSRLSATTEPMGESERESSEQPKWRRIVRGELDWIVMKAIEKDRSRRYDTANEFAEDIGRYLNGLAVTACPPSKWYSFQKFASRNKVALATSTIVAASLIVGLIATSVSSIRAQRAEEETREVVAFVIDDLLGLARAESQLSAGISPDSDLRLITLLDRASETLDRRYADKPEVRTRVQVVLANSYRSLGSYAKAARLLEDALKSFRVRRGETDPDTVMTMRQLGSVYLNQDRIDEANRQFEDALDATGRLPDPQRRTLRHLLLDDLATVLYRKGDFKGAESSYSKALAMKRASLGDAHPQTLTTRSKLALTYEKLDHIDRAEALHKEVLKGVRELDNDNDIGVSTALNYLGRYYLDRGRRKDNGTYFVEAEKHLLDARELLLEFPGEGRPLTIENQFLLSQAYCEQRKLHEAEGLLTDLIGRTRDQTASTTTRFYETLNMLGWVYLHQSRFEEAQNLLADLLAEAGKTNCGDNLFLRIRGNLAIVNYRLGRLEAAIQQDEQSLVLARESLGPRHPQTLASMARLGLSYIEVGRTGEGHRLLEAALASGVKLAGLTFISGIVATSYLHNGDTDGCIKWTDRQIKQARESQPTDSVAFAKLLAVCGTRLMRVDAWSKAETVLRECYRIRSKKLPDSWLGPNAQSLLGEVLMRQGKPKEALPHLREAWEKLSAYATRESILPQGFKKRRIKAINRLITVTEILGYSEEASRLENERSRLLAIER